MPNKKKTKIKVKQTTSSALTAEGNCTSALSAFKGGQNVALELQAYKLGIQQQSTQKMLEAASRALDTIIDLATNADKEAVRLKAAQDLIDRIGLGPTSKSEVVHKRDVLSDMSDQELKELADSYFANKKPTEITVINVVEKSNKRKAETGVSACSSLEDRKRSKESKRR